MSKLVLVAAAVAVLTAVSAVANPFRSAQMECQREVEESTLRLEACRQVMHYVVYKVPGQELPGSLGWSPWVHARCCQQLLKIRRECRDAAIRGLVREYEVPPEEGSGESVEAGHKLGETVRQEEGEEYGLPSAPRFSTEQEAAHRRLVKAQQFAAKLPVMCRYETAQGPGASSADLY
ncbi:hypothetical protein ACQ4PT_020909 [Festuca glaucescens]